MREKYPKLEFDRLKMYFGESLVRECRHGAISILTPSIGDIIRVGEEKFFSSLNIFIANTTSYRLFLADLGADWNDVTDFELFCLMYKSIDPEVSKLLFGNLDFLNFKVLALNANDGTKRMVLVDQDNDIEIDEDVYQTIHQYYQMMFNMHPEDAFTTDERLKRWWIEKDRREQERNRQKKSTEKYSLQPIVSALVNHPGFKYKLQELKEVTVAEFYDSVQRLQIYEQSTALMHGLYGGMISGKDIEPDSYNFMREIKSL